MTLMRATKEKTDRIVTCMTLVGSWENGVGAILGACLADWMLLLKKRTRKLELTVVQDSE